MGKGMSVQAVLRATTCNRRRVYCYCSRFVKDECIHAHMEYSCRCPCLVRVEECSGTRYSAGSLGGHTLVLEAIVNALKSAGPVSCR